MTDEELRDALVRLAKRTGFSFTEIDYMARIISQADHDPLPPEDWGEPYEFARRKLSVFDDPDDLSCINAEVPKPDAQVDLRAAWRQFKHDATNVDRIYAMNAEISLVSHWRLFLNQLDWVRFWSVRHSDVKARKKFKRSLLELDAAAKRIVGKADGRLRERLMQTEYDHVTSH